MKFNFHFPVCELQIIREFCDQKKQNPSDVGTHSETEYDKNSKVTSIAVNA